MLDQKVYQHEDLFYFSHFLCTSKTEDLTRSKKYPRRSKEEMCSEQFQYFGSRQRIFLFQICTKNCNSYTYIYFTILQYLYCYMYLDSISDFLEVILSRLCLCEKSIIFIRSSQSYRFLKQIKNQFSGGITYIYDDAHSH